jgi:hypothetical protein
LRAQRQIQEGANHRKFGAEAPLAQAFHASVVRFATACLTTAKNFPAREGRAVHLTMNIRHDGQPDPSRPGFSTKCCHINNNRLSSGQAWSDISYYSSNRQVAGKRTGDGAVLCTLISPRTTRRPAPCLPQGILQTREFIDFSRCLINIITFPYHPHQSPRQPGNSAGTWSSAPQSRPRSVQGWGSGCVN